MARAPKGALTGTNIHACFRGLRDGNGVVGPVVDASSLPHFRRCIANGLLVPGDTKGTFKLGEAFAEQFGTFQRERDAHDAWLQETSPAAKVQRDVNREYERGQLERAGAAWARRNG